MWNRIKHLNIHCKSSKQVQWCWSHAGVRVQPMSEYNPSKEQTNPVLVKAVVESEGMLGASGGLINSTFT